MQRQEPHVSLVVPCFDEGPRVDPLLDRILDWGRSRPDLDWELVCVDDGSRDDTAARLASRAESEPNLRVLLSPENEGKGGALRRGVAASRGEVVVFLDADLAVDPSHVDEVLPALKDGVDVAVGSRALEGARVLRPQPWLRRLLGRGYLLLARRLLDLGVSDVTCGFKGFRGETARRLFAASRCRRWGIDAEILHLARRDGLVVREFPVAWTDGIRSAVRPWRDAVGAAVELARVRWRP
jgi:glycosyltransferase involved in cell wall biosynthesis